MSIITLSHGSGGKDTQDLMKSIFYKHFNNDILLQENDSSIVEKVKGRLAITTDSFVINPLFFPGGDIGKLSICGTINDLSVVGATPLYLTAGFIIEEGFSVNLLNKIVFSMKQASKMAKVKVIAGDTKVVEKGSADGVYINTTGIGILKEENEYLCSNNIKVGDKIIVSGTLGEHGISIITKRQGIDFDVTIKSDCNMILPLVQDIMKVSKNIKVMRDPTRGGLATILNELIHNKNLSMLLKEENIPIKDEVLGACEILGLDPLYIANEGKVVIIVSKEDANKVLDAMKKNPLGKDASVIGEVIDDDENRVYLKTKMGGTRVLNSIEEDLIPRIC
ncbi:MAG: hydrogenase expression/formation protein HypE [Clostridium cochlearium]|uniref:hydrogenase expression/formation protein HypE n=1 Tax=Clostridium cochlearium TaxID=1494 RepID=UPI00280C1E1F|nr:hydrogenase expression/formation protein HypE [Clostridium cochlearium]MDU1441932.1 hydrogenase expression/formation protein HypE [Clostridium cochlearium]